MRSGEQGMRSTKQVPPPVTPRTSTGLTAPGCPHAPAPAQDVARRILGEDVTQIDYYSERVKRMEGKVHLHVSITRCGRGTYALVGGVAESFCAAVKLSDAERDQLPVLNRKPSSRQ